MKRPLNPPSVRAPFGHYSHGLLVTGVTDLLVTSGQLGIAPDDTVPDDVEAQAVLCFEAVAAILRGGGMDFSDVIRVAGFVTDRAHFPVYMAVRDRYTRLPRPASTLLIVSGFTRPEFKVEVEVTAARRG
ncbi:RidA family protein [Methylobrevis pamukkalensis]|uniref:Enamine/imine deaminase n=1 Tax=Methylobrevis pamukkalensis TaxID=1439726 RepID=A0A1E3H6K6_9HYPH|nr:RidA family protein [Methylobrevis pamukkalensis]ODN71953.1 Enamine/imine deaminase [Methylobrevis pamukkalensis]